MSHALRWPETSVTTTQRRVTQNSEDLTYNANEALSVDYLSFTPLLGGEAQQPPSEYEIDTHHHKLSSTTRTFL